MLIFSVCSSHRSISFRESMPPAKRFDHSQTNQLAERINSFFFSRTIFSSPLFFFSWVDGQRTISRQPKQTSLTPTATDSTWNPIAEEHAAASFTHASYKPRTNILTNDTKGTLSHSYSFTPATIINLSLLCCLKEVKLFICLAK